MLRDITGCAEEAIEVDPGARVDAIFERYAVEFPRLGELRASIVLASNQQFCDRSEMVREGDEIAFLPPVSGGSGAIRSRFSTPGRGIFLL
jgi:MoaE-MoaD fusion protein